MLNIDTAITGCNTNGALREAVFEHARTTLPNSYIIDGDFMNLNGLNQALGREAANDFIRLACQIYYSELKALNPGFLYACRQHGDELTLMLDGVAEEKVKDALTRARLAVDKFVKDSGLDGLQHLKYKNISGVGFITALRPLYKTTPSLSQTSDELQEDITRQKKALPHNDDIRPYKDYINNHSRIRFREALHHAGAGQAPKGMGPLSIPSTLPYQETALTDTRTSRHESLLDALKMPRQSVIRFDLYNLGGLNSHLGPAYADHIIADIKNIVREELNLHYPDARLFDGGGGMLDVMLPEPDEVRITDLKKQIHERLFKEILSKTVTEYAISHGLDERGDRRIGRIPYKDGSHEGVGLVMSHIMTPPKEDGQNQADILARLDAISQIQKMHAAAFLERTADGTLRLYRLFPVGRAIDDTELIPDRDAHESYSLPYAASLRDRISTANLAKLLQEPIGIIYQRLFGIDVTSVLKRQKILDDYMDAPENNRVALMPGEAKMVMKPLDYWAAAKNKMASSYDLMDCPDTKTRESATHTTISLTKNWLNGLSSVTVQLFPTILKMQSALRTVSLLDGPTGKHDRLQSCLFLQHDIRKHMITEPNDSLQRIQACEQACAIIKHVANICDETMPASAKDAIKTIILQTLTEAQKCTLKNKELNLSTHINVMHHNHALKISTPVSMPVALLQRELSQAQIKIENRTDITADTKSAILKNINNIIYAFKICDDVKFTPLPQTQQPPAIHP